MDTRQQMETIARQLAEGQEPKRTHLTPVVPADHPAAGPVTFNLSVPLEEADYVRRPDLYRRSEVEAAKRRMKRQRERQETAKASRRRNRPPAKTKKKSRRGK